MTNSGIEKKRAEIAVIQREINRGNILSDTVADKMNERHEVDTRKEASDKFKVSERKVRTVQEIEKTAPYGKSSLEETVSSEDYIEQERSRKIASKN